MRGGGREERKIIERRTCSNCFAGSMSCFHVYSSICGKWKKNEKKRRAQNGKKKKRLEKQQTGVGSREYTVGSSNSNPFPTQKRKRKKKKKKKSPTHNLISN